jgi:hypothetical protein
VLYHGFRAFFANKTSKFLPVFLQNPTKKAAFPLIGKTALPLLK